MLYEVTTKPLLKTYQTVMFFPHFVSWIVAGYMMFSFLNVELGILNGFLDKLDIETVNWYTKPGYWPGILTVSYLWKHVGYSSIIYYAGLMGVDKEYYEAAEIDGATKLQMVMKISLPSIMPLISILTILAIGRIFYADFGMFYHLTRDSSVLYPTTDVIDTYVYRSLRHLGDASMASAVGLYQSLIGFVLVVTTNFITKKLNSENALF